MWSRCKGYIIGAVVGFLVAFFMVKAILREPVTTITTPDKTVEVRLVTKIDTLFIPQNFYHSDTLKTTITRVDTVFTPTKEVATIPAIKRQYEDSLEISKNVVVGYKAQTTGTLDNIQLSYHNTKSIVVIHKQDSIFTNTTITKRPGGLFIGVDGGYSQVTPKLEYIKNNNAFSAGYNIINKSPQIGYSRKIF